MSKKYGELKDADGNSLYSRTAWGLIDNKPTVPRKTSELVNDSKFMVETKCTYQTFAPTSAISDGGVHIVYLTSEPATKYDGYIYLIAEE